MELQSSLSEEETQSSEETCSEITETVLSKPLNLTPIIKNLLNLADLFDDIKMQLSNLKVSLVTQALESAIKEILDGYNISAAETQTIENEEETIFSPRKMLPWARSAMVILQFISCFLQEADDKVGGQLLNPISKFLAHGNKIIHQLFQDFLNKASVPLLQMIWHWVVKGSLIDPYDEFFVKENVNYGINYWNGQFTLRKEYLPNSINENIGKLITNTGRTMNFINQYCPERALVLISNRKDMFEFQSFTSKSLIKEDNCFEEYLKALKSENSAIVFEILETKYKLRYFLTNIHNFILLSRGHFVRLFMINMNNYFKTSSEVTVQHLRSILVSAILDTTLIRKDDNVINDITIELNHPVHTISDLFTLKYKLPAPNGLIFKVCEKSYKRISMFLWKKYHATYLLSDTWKTLRELLRRVDLISDLHQGLKCDYNYNFQLLQLMYQLDFYMMYEIIERHWKNFFDVYLKSNDVEQVIAIHTQMMAYMLHGTLQGGQLKDLGFKLKQVFLLVIEIQDFVQTLYTLIKESTSSSDTNIHLKITAKQELLLKTYQVAEQKKN